MIRVEVRNLGGEWIKVTDSPLKPGTKIAPGQAGTFETDEVSAMILEKTEDSAGGASSDPYKGA